MKIQELIFALVQKSAQRVGKWCEKQGLHLAHSSKRAQANENEDASALVPAKKCADGEDCC
jgi:hypothetical protein